MVWIWFGFLKVGLAWQNDGAKIYEHELTLQGKYHGFLCTRGLDQGHGGHGQVCSGLDDDVAVGSGQEFAGGGGVWSAKVMEEVMEAR